MKKLVLLIILFCCILACKNETKEEPNEFTFEDKKIETTKEDSKTITEQSTAEKKAALVEKGYQIFDYVDEKTQDTVLMQQYFIAFLKRGPIRNQNEEEANRLQKAHLAHLGKMYDLGFADISGPFGDDGEIRGITIYNVPTQKMADSLANADPMVKAGRLMIEIHPWWAAKGFPLR
ncbi:YciI family protein [Winogradskyella ursingii]|uniref:YciI family protein n=1 Tax=Winogradskyella ursingii TaxID=2686079 RepID=UPI0015C97415|nr:YciI family protein [Winogradskyella ursingii]